MFQSRVLLADLSTLLDIKVVGVDINGSNMGLKLLFFFLQMLLTNADHVICNKIANIVHIYDCWQTLYDKLLTLYDKRH